MDKPLIRAATADDADFVAWTSQTAARSHVEKSWFDILLGGSESDSLEFARRLALTQVRSWWHYSWFLIAEVEGKPASALCRFRSGDGYPLSGDALREVVNSYPFSDAEQKAMWARGGYAFTCLMPSDDDCWTIENVATMPEYRGRGLTSLLIEHVLEEGRVQGCTEAQISFLIGNDRAERVYARAGFTFADEKRHPDHQAACGSPGMRKFKRRI